MWETWVRSLGWEDPLEKGKAARTSILAWRIPWTIQSMGRKESDTTERLSLHVTSLQRHITDHSTLTEIAGRGQWYPWAKHTGEESACDAGDAVGACSVPGSVWPPGRGITIHSSILNWRIPWTQEPGRLWPIGSRRVRHDSSDWPQVWNIQRLKFRCTEVVVNWKAEFNKRGIYIEKEHQNSA